MKNHIFGFTRSTRSPWLLPHRGHRRDAQFARGKRKMRAKSRKGASITVTAVADNTRQPLSAARVAAPSREETARKMRFRIAKLSINRYWVICDQSRF